MKASDRFLRDTKDNLPSSAKKGGNPNKARLTPLSYDSLKKNISKNKIKEKIDKYNEEYARLVEIARTVHSGRKEAEGKTGEEQQLAYADVDRAIGAYNAQAAKLAAVGVQVLAFDKGIRKIAFGKYAAVKAIKVPQFVIKALSMFNEAAKNTIKEQERAAAKLEKQVQEAILSVAQEGIGQTPKDAAMALRGIETVDKLGDVVVDKLENPAPPVAESEMPKAVTDSNVVVPAPQPEMPAPAKEPIQSVEPEKQVVQEDPLKKAMAAGAKKAQGEVSKDVDALSDAMRKANKQSKVSNIDKMLEDASSILGKKEEAFNVLKQLNNAFFVKKLGEQKRLLLRDTKANKGFFIEPEIFTRKMKFEGENVQEQYAHFVNVCNVANAWNVAFGKDAYADENKAIFDMIVDGVREEKDNAAILGDVQVALGDEGRAKEVVEKMAPLLRDGGLTSIDSFVPVESKADEVEKVAEAAPEVVEMPAPMSPVVEQVEDDKLERKIRLTDETLKRLANGFVLKPGATPLQEEALVVEKEQQQVAPVAEEKAPESDFVSKLNNLSAELEALAKVKNNLSKTGINNQALLDKIDAAINAKTTELDALLGNNLNLENQAAERLVEAETHVDENVVENEQPVVVPGSEMQQLADELVSILDAPRREAEQEAPVVTPIAENIDLVMELVSKGNADKRYDEEQVSHEYFDNNPGLREMYENQYPSPANENFWESVLNGYTPVTSMNPAVEGVRLDKKQKAARDFLGFAYSLDDNMLDEMERNGDSPLKIVNSLPKADVEKNLDLYGRYLEAKRERVEAKRSSM